MSRQRSTTGDTSRFGDCTLCGRKNLYLKKKKPCLCGWCADKLTSGMTWEQVEEEFINNPPKGQGEQGPKPTLADVATASEQMERKPMAQQVQEHLDRMKVYQQVPKKKTKPEAPAIPVFPVKTMVPVFTTSDGREFGSEVDALRHALDLAQSEIVRLTKRLKRRGEV